MRSDLTLRTFKQHPMLLAGGVLAIGLLVMLMPRGHSSVRVASAPVKRVVPTMVVASHALSAGTTVSASDVEEKPALGSVPAGAISSENDVLGRVVVKSYTAKQAILRDDVHDASTLGIAARVLPGQRAFSIRIGEDDIVGGFLQSGDHVDVFATIPGSVFPSKNAGDVPDRSRAILLLQNILVLAVGENKAPHGSVQSDARTVSLSLSPDGLARLALAQRYGKVSLAIRVPGDTSEAKDVSAVLADLVPYEAPASEPEHHAVAPRHRMASGIPFLSGVNTSSLSFGASR